MNRYNFAYMGSLVGFALALFAGSTPAAIGFLIPVVMFTLAGKTYRPAKKDLGYLGSLVGFALALFAGSTPAAIGFLIPVVMFTIKKHRRGEAER